MLVLSWCQLSYHVDFIIAGGRTHGALQEDTCTLNDAWWDQRGSQAATRTAIVMVQALLLQGFTGGRVVARLTTSGRMILFFRSLLCVQPPPRLLASLVLLVSCFATFLNNL